MRHRRIDHTASPIQPNTTLLLVGGLEVVVLILSRERTRNTGYVDRPPVTSTTSESLDPTISEPGLWSEVPGEVTPLPHTVYRVTEKGLPWVRLVSSDLSHSVDRNKVFSTSSCLNDTRTCVSRSFRLSSYTTITIGDRGVYVTRGWGSGDRRDVGLFRKILRLD